MLKCPNEICKADNPDDAKFCEVCGTPLTQGNIATNSTDAEQQYRQALLAAYGQGSLSLDVRRKLISLQKTLNMPFQKALEMEKNIKEELQRQKIENEQRVIAEAKAAEERAAAEKATAEKEAAEKAEAEKRIAAEKAVAEQAELNREIVCHSCGKSYKHTKKFCPECGAPNKELNPDKWVCTKCGKEFSEPSKFCEECGGEIKLAMAENDAKQIKASISPVKTAPPMEEKEKNLPVKCIKCGKEFPYEQKYCPFCGRSNQKINPDKYICCKCKKEYTEVTSRCEACGSKVIPPRTRVGYVWLSILYSLCGLSGLQHLYLQKKWLTILHWGGTASAIIIGSVIQYHFMAEQSTYFAKAYPYYLKYIFGNEYGFLGKFWFDEESGWMTLTIYCISVLLSIILMCKIKKDGFERDLL